MYEKKYNLRTGVIYSQRTLVEGRPTVYSRISSNIVIIISLTHEQTTDAHKKEPTQEGINTNKHQGSPNSYLVHGLP